MNDIATEELLLREHRRLLPHIVREVVLKVRDATGLDAAGKAERVRDRAEFEELNFPPGALVEFVRGVLDKDDALAKKILGLLREAGEAGMPMSGVLMKVNYLWRAREILNRLQGQGLVRLEAGRNGGLRCFAIATQQVKTEAAD